MSTRPSRDEREAELRREFPPRWLKGLCDGLLYWRSPETVARDRKMQALCDADAADST